MNNALLCEVDFLCYADCQTRVCMNVSMQGNLLLSFNGVSEDCCEKEARS